MLATIYYAVSMLMPLPLHAIAEMPAAAAISPPIDIAAAAAAATPCRCFRCRQPIFRHAFLRHAVQNR